MKKVFVVIIALFLVCSGHQKLNAIEKSSYQSNIYNLIDNKNAIKYDSSDQRYFIDGYVSIVGRTNYTIVFSYDFIGGFALEDYSFLEDVSLECSYVTDSDVDDEVDLTISCNYAGAYVISFSASESGKLYITDLLVDQVISDETLYNEFMIYKGDISDFTGFDSYYDESNSFVGANKSISIYVSSSDALFESELRKLIVANDGVDGDLTDMIELEEDEYTENHRVPGLYNVIYRVVDTSGNVSRLTILVNVIDKIKPVITGVTEYDWVMSKGDFITEVDIKDMLEANDETDENLSNDIYVINSNISSYVENKESSYTILYGVKDLSGNESTHEVVINVIDDIPPVIVASNINISLSDEFFTWNDLVNTISYSDNSNQFASNPLQITDVDKFYDNLKVPGTYEFKIVVKDAANNSSTKVIYLTLVDDISPNFYISNLILNTTVDDLFSTASLSEIIINNILLLNASYENFEIISTDYFDNYNKAGKYAVNYSYEVDGVVKYETISINVSDDDNSTSNYFVVGFIMLAGIGWVFYLKRKNKINI